MAAVAFLDVVPAHTGPQPRNAKDPRSDPHDGCVMQARMRCTTPSYAQHPGICEAIHTMHARQAESSQDASPMTDNAPRSRQTQAAESLIAS